MGDIGTVPFKDSMFIEALLISTALVVGLAYVAVEIRGFTDQLGDIYAELVSRLDAPQKEQPK
jgi:hypothetical protein